MSTSDATSPNKEQIEFWNDEPARRWVAFSAALDAQLESLGRRAMDAAQLRANDHVIDIGCGCGTTTLAIARLVGPGGAVRGIDISVPMLTRAREGAAEIGCANVTFINADAQTYDFRGVQADAIFSRFGVMFFADPRAAFANLRTALKPGGRLAFVCWRSVPENPWMAVPMMAAMQHVQLPPPPAPDAPGPFAFADDARVRSILADAGFADVNTTPSDEKLTVGGTDSLDDAVKFLLELGPTARVLREANADPSVLPRVAAAVRAAIEPYHGPRGVEMNGAVWVVTARN